MNLVIVDSQEPIALVGGGAASVADLDEARKLTADVVAVDGGAALCLASGVMPRAVIGDMDSLPAVTRATLPPGRVHHIAEQDSTDFDKALRSISAPLIIGVGFLGKRLDHQLAALNRLVARPDKRIILVDNEDIVFLAPPKLNLPLEDGARVSLFPMAAVRGTSAGLHWPIDGIEMSPDQRVGTSNLATGPVILQMEAASMLILLPRACLSLAVQALRAHAPWPARAE
ncbi:thiamine diphosphokinase [Roseobacteraceae bacterium S113]